MGKKATKATKRFVASGQLKKTIQARHKHQQIQRKIQGRKKPRDGKSKYDEKGGEDGKREDDEDSKSKSSKRMTVDDFLSGDFMDASDDNEETIRDEEVEDDENDEQDEEEEDFDDDASFASVDELDEEGEEHLLELSKLAEKDPEFYKYLQENDRELLDFNPDGLKVGSEDEDVDEDGDVDMEDGKLPVLTKEHLQKWQKAILQQRSLRALRKLLVAFRSAAHMNEDDQVLAWSIDSASVYNKLVTTALKYTPVVLEHHIPYKTLANGKFKAPTQTPKFKTLQKLILSYFYNVIHILSQLTDNDLLHLAITETSKIIPYIISSRKAVKTYLKKTLELWSSAEDSIRMASFLSIRKLAGAPDESIMDNILKSTYLALIRSSKSTSTHTLPSINLMKNSASEIFCVDHAMAYQHAFGYIRQLAIHLRNSMKVKTKEAYKQVYNWQYIHCIDFWCIVLARACDFRAEVEAGKESELRPLIYPLVQVALGSIKLIPNSRSHPFHLHVIRSLLHLSKHTGTYIPISPYLISILNSSLSPSSRPKSSTLRPLDLDVHIRVPQQYMKTRVYSEGITEEAIFLLVEWLASPAVHGSIAFPEIAVPIVVTLRKSMKNAKQGVSKEQGLLKGLLERADESAKWIEEKRKLVTFSPAKMSAVRDWEDALKEKLADAPLSKYLKVQRKTREKRRKLVEKARDGKDEILED
ncbi:Noc2p family-domain-containing protein [Crucibulum laeve]|uniref:Noc2p family-domain-containing protein n=1 Tax=Crucibulum laeve TaxID=68775 RepID=A0A5C3LY36_9AGAR|nr:Noc2p family-domain-containing protein [Crucibulum laeve]